ncbi:hypothetical protein PFLUV_G00246950 [Perca fluviatilis]|uniref:Uncharacterized protein n=1 Tax=Perca fluviatilis TaxID=8168 RepID=A0A6A5E6D4_PERFL|nr:hypothetical protein PFLUV_G00246950 [Perca fluviatilis]
MVLGCMVVYGVISKRCKTVASAFPERLPENAQAVLNVPLVLIVKPRKHRKVSTTLQTANGDCGSTLVINRRGVLRGQPH